MKITPYVPNPKFADEWQASEDAVALGLRYAEAAAPLARNAAPKLSGDLEDSIVAVAGVVDGQATGRLVAKDFKAHWLEFGTRRSDSGGRAQPFLRPAMEAVTGQPVTGGRQ